MSEISRAEKLQQALSYDHFDRRILFFLNDKGNAVNHTDHFLAFHNDFITETGWDRLAVVHKLTLKPTGYQNGIFYGKRSMLIAKCRLDIKQLALGTG